MGDHSADPRENDRVKEDLSKAVKKARDIKKADDAKKGNGK